MALQNKQNNDTDGWQKIKDHNLLIVTTDTVQDWAAARQILAMIRGV